MSQRLLTDAEAQTYQEIIDGYQPGRQTVEDFSGSKFAVIAGPTGAGKDTLRSAMIERSPYFASVLSTTSRPPRPGEQDGIDYHFRPLEFFEKGFKEQRFLQAALVHSQQISCLDINDIRKLGPRQIGLSILIVQTEIGLRALNPKLKTIFLIPPDLDTLLARMQAGREVGQDEVSRRLNAAKAELQIALRQPDYYCIVSDDVQRMVATALQFLIEERLDDSENTRARSIIEKILEELQTA
jgi:guanylate kinase